MADSAKIPDDVDILHYPVGKSKTINGILKLLRRPWTVTFSPNGKNEFLSSEESVILDLKLVDLPPPSLSPFELVATTNDSGKPRLNVVNSTLAGELPTDFSPGEAFLLTPETGTRLVYGKLTIDDTTGEVTAIEILQAATVPEDTAALRHVLIGNYVFADGEFTSVSNYRYGPIDVEICRNWHAASAPFYGATFLGT